MILYRPVGLQELELIYDSGMKAFPARLPKQPIFYPVLDLEYARQTASDWNVKNGKYAGYVTQFKVEDKYIKKFETHKVGHTQHEEFWIPAENIEEFNKHLIGHIKVIEAYFGKKFEGFVPEAFGLQGKNAVEQFTLLANSYVYKRMDFYLEIKRNHKAVFLNYPFWQKHEFKNPGLKAKVIQAIKEAWLTSFPTNPLVTPAQEEVRPAKPTDSQPTVSPLEEEIAPGKPKAPGSLSPAFRKDPKAGEGSDLPNPSVSAKFRSGLPNPNKPENNFQRVSKDPKPVRARNVPTPVNPAREEIKPIKPNDPKPLPPKDPPPIQQTNVPASMDSFEEETSDSESLDEQTTPTRQPDAQPLLNPVEEFTLEEEDDLESFEEETRPTRQTDVRPLINPVEPFSFEEESDSESFLDLDEEDTVPAPGTTSRHLIDLDEEETIPEKETDSESLLDLDEEDEEDEEEDDDSTLIQPTDSPPPSHTVREEPTPLRPREAPSFVRPVQQPVMPGKPTPSHLSQGLEAGFNGQYHAAIDELTRAVAETPDDLAAYTSLGVAFQRVGEEDRALSCYEIVLRRNPGYAEAHYFRANTLYRQGNSREAIAEYTTAIGLQPELVQAHQRPIPKDRLTDYNSTPAEMPRIARPAHRILALNQAIARNPAQASLFKERAAEYFRLWNYEQTIADYTAYLALQPRDADALHLRGVAYEQLEQFERASADYQKAVAVDPQLSSTYLQRGVALGQNGNFRQSIASLTEGIRLAPRNPDSHFNRGTSYFQVGDFERAIEDFSVVIQLSPKDDAAYYWRGLSNEAAGRRDAAIADYQQVLTLSQDKSTREEIEKKLRRWKVKSRNVFSSQSASPEESQKPNKVPLEEAPQEIDLYDLIAALGQRALNSVWLGSDVECYGDKARALHALTDDNSPIPGREFLDLTSGIRRTVRGDFQAFDPDASSPWLFLRAWEGNGFYVETNDPRIKKQLKSQFPSLEEVEGAAPPYESVFIAK